MVNHIHDNINFNLIYRCDSIHSLHVHQVLWTYVGMKPPTLPSNMEMILHLKLMLALLTDARVLFKGMNINLT